MEVCRARRMLISLRLVQITGRLSVYVLVYAVHTTLRARLSFYPDSPGAAIGAWQASRSAC